MKNLITTAIAILFVMTGCGGNKQAGDDLITVDVTASYPKKELILQDFMDVEYIPLETNDEFLCQGFVQDISKNIIAVKNFINDGNIFIFDRKNGKGLKKINRRGQGGEEYNFIKGITLDEDNRELYVNDLSKKVLVYDLEGNYKRSFKQKEGAMYEFIYNFDEEHLICYDGYVSNDGIANKQAFMIISRQDGSVSREIQIPFEKKLIKDVIVKEEANGMTWGASPSSYYPIIHYLDHWILLEPSSDTLYSYSPDHVMTPFISRTPSIQSMNTEKFLSLNVLTNQYYFMETIERIYDFVANSGFPSTDLMYDKQEKKIFRYTVYNGDYSNKESAYMKSRPVGNSIATWQFLQAHKLVDAYEKGLLKGRLKEIAAELDEESNPVIMIAKHKK